MILSPSNFAGTPPRHRVCATAVSFNVGDTPTSCLRPNQVVKLGLGELLVLFATSVLTLPVVCGRRVAHHAAKPTMADIELALLLLPGRLIA